jgi:hypothetical protein
MSKGFSAYRYYMAIKLHFTSDTYNLFEHNGHVKCSLDTFNKRNDKYLFEKLMKNFSTERECVEYLAANFMRGNSEAVYDVEQGMENYTRYLKNKQSLYRIVENDLGKLSLLAEVEKYENPWQEIHYGSGETHPVLFQMLQGGNIEHETCVILNHFENFVPSWKKTLGFFSETAKRIEKSDRFIKFDIQRFNELYYRYKEELQNQNG